MKIRIAVLVGCVMAGSLLSAHALAAVAGEVILASDATVGEKVLVLPGGGIAETVGCADDLSNGPGARYYVRAEPNGAAEQYQIVVYDESCGSPVTLFSDVSFDIEVLRWSPDGNRLGFSAKLYDRATGGELKRGIFVGDVVRVAGLPVTLSNVRFTVPMSFAGIFQWAPDGRRVVFDAETAGQYDILVDDLDPATAAVNLTNSSESERAPAVSPDGSRIAFTKTTVLRGMTRIDVFTMPASGGAQVQLTTKSNTKTSQNLQPSWSPDGRSIAFSGMPNGQIVRHVYRIPSDGSGKALNLTPDTDHLLFAPQWRV
jgi:Tol biopolymer transport system component